MIVSDAFGPRVRWAFADRSDGSSLPPYDRGNLADHVGDDPAHVAANRAALARAVGLGGADVVAMAPVHGNGVGVVDARTDEPVADVDALVTATPGLALLVVAADCVPVLLADDTAGVAAVVHAGWRGVRSDVASAALEAMVHLGAATDRTTAVVGPAICGGCYDVPPQRYDDVVAVAPAAAARSRSGGPGLDVRAAVVATLESAGVLVRLVGGCTVETAELYSFRRDGVTGRHGGLVAVAAPAGEAS